MGWMGRRKGRRTRSDEGKHGEHPLDSWELMHSPYTFEGELEGIARFARGLSRALPHKRRLGLVVFLVVIGIPFVIGLITFVVSLVR